MQSKTEMMFLRLSPEDREYFERNKSEIKKLRSNLKSEAKQEPKIKKCFLCKTNCKSFANSHSVPKFCLRRIAQDGKVYVSGLQQEFPVFGDDTGINVAGTFRFICRLCDNTKFQEYENPDAYSDNISPTIIAQIAMKNALYRIATKKDELSLYRTIDQKYNSIPGYDLPRQQIAILPHDITQYTEDFRYAKVAAQNNKDDRYRVVFYNKLNYVVPFAFQDTITMICDFEGNVINDIYDTEKFPKLQDIEIAVFPLQSETVVLVYTDIRNRKYDRFIQHFNSLPISEQLSTINFIIFAYSENVFVSKTLKDTVMKNKKFLECCQMETTGICYGSNPEFLSAAVRSFSLSKRNEIPNLLSSEYSL